MFDTIFDVITMADGVIRCICHHFFKMLKLLQFLRYDAHFWHTGSSQPCPQKLHVRFLIFGPEVLLCACAGFVMNGNSLIFEARMLKLTA